MILFQVVALLLIEDSNSKCMFFFRPTMVPSVDPKTDVCGCSAPPAITVSRIAANDDKHLSKGALSKVFQSVFIVLWIKSTQWLQKMLDDWDRKRIPKKLSPVCF